MTTATTLVVGATAGAREAAIAELLLAAPLGPIHIILEGLADGDDRIGAALATRPDLAPPQVARIASGCPCCTGNLVMRVTLNRMLKPAPAQLYLSLAATDHTRAVRDFLSQPPYDRLLSLQDDIDLSHASSSRTNSPL